jgi:DNA-directed RNA polymerase I subunit RPA1
MLLCCSTLQEMTDVFKAYGIVIDPRHLTLIADFMTFLGTYRPFNRIGIESSASPLQQMSFETVVTFLRDATLTGTDRCVLKYMERSCIRERLV